MPWPAVPLALLRREQELHEVGADGKIVAVSGDDEGREITDRIGGWVEDGGDERKNVAADRVLERVQFDAGDAVAEIDEPRRPGLARRTPGERRKSATRAWPGTPGMGTSRLVAGWKQASRSGQHRQRAIHTQKGLPRERRLMEGESLHAGDGFSDSRGIPTFQRDPAPNRSQHALRRRWKARRRDFADAIGGEVQQRGKERAKSNTQET